MSVSSVQNTIEPFFALFQTEKQPDAPSINDRLQRGIFRRLRRRELKHASNLIGAYKETIYQQYAKALMAFDYPDISDHSKYNILDTSGIYMTHDENILLKMQHLMLRSESMTYHSKTGWYAFLPCFQNGFMHYADTEDFYFQLLNINEEQHSVQIRMVSCTDINRKCPLCLFAVEALVYLPQTEEESVDVQIKHLLTHSEIYQSLSETDLHWNSLDTKFWNIHLKQFQNGLSDMNQSAAFTEHIVSDIRLFFMYNLMANYIMSKEAHSAPAASPTEKPKDTHPHPKKEFKPSEGAQPRTVHTFSNNLKVHAPRDWKPVKSPKVLHYTMESWTVRGHIRHYKNGRTVYIKPRVNHRKGTPGSQNPGTTTIKIKP